MAINLVRCEHLGDALECIGREHVPNRWLYRGQRYRREVHRITDEDRVFELENLYPQSFRFAASHTRISEDFTEMWQKEYAKAESLFHAFNSFLISKYEAAQRTDSGRFTWMEPYADELKRLFHNSGPAVFSGFHEKNIGLKNPEFIRLSWSLAQHYGVVTALLDLTFDPDVAAWFATNLWNAPAESQLLKGEGIIYRFDIEMLNAGIYYYNMVNSVSGSNIYKAPPDKAFIQDLRRIPADFALRPIRQEAAVVSGFDALKFVRQFDIAGKIDAFVFPHFGDQLLRWPLKHSREYLIPPDDPFIDLKREFDAKWKPRAEQTFGGVKYTKPVVILADDGPKFANIPDEVAERDFEAKRQQLYESGMASLGTDLGEAEHKFHAVIRKTPYAAADRLSSLAYARIALIRLLRDDFSGTVEALGRSLECPDRNPTESWIGQLLQTTAQGCQMLRSKGQGQLALPVLKRLAAIAHRAVPGALALEAELGAILLVGELELERGNMQAGLAALKSVAQTPLAGLTPPERSMVASALLDLAKTHEALGDAGRARFLYEKIVARFGNDEWPSTVKAVACARASF